MSASKHDAHPGQLRSVRFPGTKFIYVCRAQVPDIRLRCRKAMRAPSTLAARGRPGQFERFRARARPMSAAFCAASRN